MGMSVHIEAFRPPNEKWKRLKAVYDSCVAAGIDPPDDVAEFFNYEGPDNAGVKLCLDYPQVHECLSEWRGEASSGYEIDLTKLPKDITILRFYNSW